MTDPSTDTEYELYDEDDILDEDSDEEWQEGDCDHCSGYVPGPDDRSLTPACACKIGQGADEGDCECGDGS